MSFKEHINRVKHFHDSFNIKNHHSPTLLSKEEYELRYNLIKEENEEYLNACKNNDIVEIADALGDILYIALGTLLRHGLHDKIDEVFEEIHNSNMSKLDDNGKPIYREDGKVLKGPNYFKPNIKKILGINE
jgi:predicted HAD superfamily Cof-like phosphohydrolase